MQIENGVFNLFELYTQVYTCTYTQVNVPVCVRASVCAVPV